MHNTMISSRKCRPRNSSDRLSHIRFTVSDRRCGRLRYYPTDVPLQIRPRSHARESTTRASLGELQNVVDIQIPWRSEPRRQVRDFLACLLVGLVVACFYPVASYQPVAGLLL